MAGGPVFYKQQQRLFPKLWQRHLAIGIIVSIVGHFGWKYHLLSFDRYDTFKGRTYLYGRDNIDAGMQK